MLRADEFASLDWDSKPSRAQLTDVLRVHDYHYVQKLGEDLSLGGGMETLFGGQALCSLMGRMPCALLIRSPWLVCTISAVPFLNVANAVELFFQDEGVRDHDIAMW